jgi:NAD(P)H-hydrate epimerase
MKEIELSAINDFGVPASILMENAGSNTVTAMTNEFGPMFFRKVCVFCGSGNNGGDGFVIARHLTSEGAHVKIFLIGSTETFSPETRKNYDLAVKYGISVIVLSSMADIEKNRQDILSAEIFVDALLGTGVNRDVDGFMAQAVVYLNILDRKTVAVDVPTGVDSDTGEIRGVAVYADLTVTFGLPKVGLTIFPALSNVGKLVVADINFPPELLFKPRHSVLITHEIIKPMFPYRNPNSNKGNFGPILIIGGAPGMSGAVVLAAKAAIRSGSGVVNVCIPGGLYNTVKPGCDEMIVTGLKQNAAGMLSLDNYEAIISMSEKAKVVVVGPGMGRDRETQELVRKLVAGVKKPMVIDADGINAVADDKNCLKRISKDVILTPHIGEMSRLTGIRIEDIIRNKIKVVRDFVREYGVNVLLKDGRSILADTKGNIYINTTGNSGMATPGSGDVLTGHISALTAHGISTVQAGILGSFVHGTAGDMLLNETSEEGITAGDIAEYLPKAIKKLK